MMESRIISLVKENQQLAQDQEHSPAVGHISVNSQEKTSPEEVQRVYHKMESFKNSNARLEFTKTMREFGNNIIWTDETKINLHQQNAKRKEVTARDLKLPPNL